MKVELDDKGHVITVLLNGRIVATISGDRRQLAATSLANALLSEYNSTNDSNTSDHPCGGRYEQQWETRG